jgi:UDP-glucose 4-epimerase
MGEGLTVAVTGPTGDVGRALLRSLDRDRNVERVLGMARRPFDPAAAGLRKTTYRRGDVLDRDALDDLFAEADVVVHLAFVIMGGPDETRRINLEGSTNVFRAAADAPRVKRLVYTSSVAAYGFHADNPSPLTEDVEPRGTASHYYSAQKAELEDALVAALDGSGTDAYVFRPCIVAGADALLLVESIPFVGLTTNLPGVVRKAIGSIPLARPVIPDPGVPFQLVHADDVALALRAAIDGRGDPGVYNLAADDEVTLADLARELRWLSLPVPAVTAKAAAALVERVPGLPPEAHWIAVFTEPVVMDTSKARGGLRWRPRHSGHATLRETVTAARDAGLVA